MFLSSASWNPLILICFAIFLDLMLMIAEFFGVKKGKDCAYLWLACNILCNLGLIVFIFFPEFLISIMFCSLAIVFVLGVEIYLHYKEVALRREKRKVLE